MTRAGYTTLINTITDGGVNTAAQVRTVLHEMAKSLSITGDTRNITISLANFALWFDATGLGRLEYDGWAYCNGNNGTIDERKTVEVCYDAAEPFAATLSTAITPILGSAKNTLAANNLPAFRKASIEYSDNKFGANGVGKGPTLTGPQHHIGEDTQTGGKINLTGVDIYNPDGTPVTGGQVDVNNLQPYVVKIRIMRLQ